MLRHLLIGVLVGLVATSGCAGAHLVVRTDRGQAVPVDLQRVQPVEYGKTHGSPSTFASLVFPDATVTKALTLVMSANMVAFLGWDGFRSFVLGYRDLCVAADAAQTFGALYDAGRAYGNRMGPSMVRLVTALVTLGLSSATGMSVPVTRLPGGGQAVANGEAMGFRLGAVSSGSVAVSTTGTISLVFANEATIGGRGGTQTSAQDSKESGRVVCPRGPGSATGPVPKGYVPVSRWVNEAEARLWLKNGGTYIPHGVGGESGRVYVTVPGAPRPGGTGPIRIDFAVPSAALNAAGKEGWFQIIQPVQNMPIYNVTIICPPGM